MNKLAKSLSLAVIGTSLLSGAAMAYDYKDTAPSEKVTVSAEVPNLISLRNVPERIELEYKANQGHMTSGYHSFTVGRSGANLQTARPFHINVESNRTESGKRFGLKGPGNSDDRIYTDFYLKDDIDDSYRQLENNKDHRAFSYRPLSSPTKNINFYIEAPIDDVEGAKDGKYQAQFTITVSPI